MHLFPPGFAADIYIDSLPVFFSSYLNVFAVAMAKRLSVIAEVICTLLAEAARIYRI